MIRGLRNSVSLEGWGGKGFGSLENKAFGSFERKVPRRGGKVKGREFLILFGRKFSKDGMGLLIIDSFMLREL